MLFTCNRFNTVIIVSTLTFHGAISLAMYCDSGYLVYTYRLIMTTTQTSPKLRRQCFHFFCHRRPLFLLFTNQSRVNKSERLDPCRLLSSVSISSQWLFSPLSDRVSVCVLNSRRANETQLNCCVEKKFSVSVCFPVQPMTRRKQRNEP